MTSQIGYLKLLITRIILSGALDFEIKRVACIKSIMSPKRKFTQSSILSQNGFNNLFPSVQEINHFMEVGWLKKNEMNGDVR